MTRSGVIEIGGHRVGAGQPPLIVAEMSGNHNQSLERALAIVDAAADAGAHAVKLQTYTADTMTLDLSSAGFVIDDPDSLWSGRTLYDLYAEAHTPWEWHPAIFERCRDRGLVCFSSPFDETAVDFLETLGAPAYKIASFEIGDLRLIRRAAATGRPLIISTGMAGLGEIDEAVRAARAAGCRDLILLKCTSSYPSSGVYSNLRTIPHLAQAFDVEAGLSDHTAGIAAAIASVALGARLIEKHFTLDRSQGGVDAAFSLEPAELRALCEGTSLAWHALGSVAYGPTESEKGSLIFRRSLYVARDSMAGDVLDETNLRAIRPGFGLPAKHYEVILGKRLTRDAPAGTPLTWDLLAG